MSEWTTVATAIVAIFGAITSTYTLLSNRKEKRRQVKVELSMGLLTYEYGVSPAMVLISASNPGHRTVTLNSVSIRLPNKKNIVFPKEQGNVKLPHDLQEGKSCMMWIDAKDLAQTLKEEGFSGKIKLVGVYTDAVGTAHRSKPTHFDVNEWYKP